MKGFKIYVSTMAAIDLIERCAIDRWIIDNTKGYQRIPEEGRCALACDPEL